MSKIKSFVEFYESERISPVAQDISDLQKHFRRRDALYRVLGLPASFVKDRSVVEFGPGSGYNSLHTASYKPGRYMLVEGNRYGVESIQKLFAEHPSVLAREPELTHSLFEDYQTEERFDLVICEGTLPFQADPVGLLEHIASHTAENGMMVITTCDSISYLPECLRRFAARFLVRNLNDTEAKLERLLPEISPHLNTLAAMSRSHRDWLLDNIIQPFSGRWLLGISEVIEALGGEFSLHGSSPHFITDWRWYKALVGDPRQEFNGPGLESYWQNLHNLMNYQAEPTVGDSATNRRLKEVGDQVYRLCLASEESGADWNQLIRDLADLTKQLIAHAANMDAQTKSSLGAYENVLNQLENEATDISWGAFESWFGRGQQYVSLLRHSSS